MINKLNTSEIKMLRIDENEYPLIMKNLIKKEPSAQVKACADGIVTIFGGLKYITCLVMILLDYR